MQEKEQAEFTHHTNCEACGSSDANGVYADGHTYCFACGVHKNANGSVEKAASKKEVEKSLKPFLEWTVKGLPARSISEETAKKFGVKVGKHNGKVVQAFPYYKDGELIAVKLKDQQKNFEIIGNGSKLPFFGQNQKLLGRKLVITEGEIDALSMSQVQGNKWPVVSVPNGAQGAVRCFRQNLDWLERFEEIIIMFDMDEPGQEAAKKCAELLKPGTCKIAQLPMKDPNEMLMANQSKELIDCMWGAQSYRPDGIVSGKDLWDAVSREDIISTVDYPFEGLNRITRGLRQGELVTVTAGSGVGKSAFVRELAFHLIKKNEKVGMIMLEENPRRTALGLMGIELNKPLHISRAGVTPEDFRKAYDKIIANDNLFMYDHFGSSEVENMLNKVRFMARGLECKWVILDHLSILVSGLGDGDERRMIDNAMTMLRTLVEETGIGLILVSHLRRPSGEGHENGAETSLSQLRGSAAIGQLSDMVIGLERNQQSDGGDANVTTIRVLKNRFTGEVGKCGKMSYDPFSGRLANYTVAVDAIDGF
jgi:twinkle protein